MADHPSETSFGHSAAAQLALLHHQVSDSLVLAPSTCVSDCLGVYPARDFKKGDIACAIESATGAWVETASLPLAEEGRRFNLVLKCPNPRNVLHGKAWELVFQGDAKRFVWPNLNSSANYEGIHGLPANVKLQVADGQNGVTFLPTGTKRTIIKFYFLGCRMSNHSLVIGWCHSFGICGSSK